MPRRDRTAAKPEWLSPLRRAEGVRGVVPVRSRLVVLPYAAAGATALRPVLSGLPDDVELLGVALPGRERRFGEPPAGSLEEIVDAVVAELVAREPVPTSLFGHCMGASMAVVLALRHPELFGGLVVSGQDPPGGPWTTSDLDDAGIVEFLTAAGNTAPELLSDAFWREKLITLFRSDAEIGTQASRATAAGVALSQDLLVLGGAEDPYVDAGPLSGWAACTTGRCEVLVLPGDHFFVLDPSNIPVIARPLGDLVLGAPASNTGGDHGGSTRVG